MPEEPPAVGRPRPHPSASSPFMLSSDSRTAPPASEMARLTPSLPQRHGLQLIHPGDEGDRGYAPARSGGAPRDTPPARCRPGRCRHRYCRRRSSRRRPVDRGGATGRSPDVSSASEPASGRRPEHCRTGRNGAPADPRRCLSWPDGAQSRVPWRRAVRRERCRRTASYAAWIHHQPQCAGVSGGKRAGRCCCTEGEAELGDDIGHLRNCRGSNLVRMVQHVRGCSDGLRQPARRRLLDGGPFATAGPGTVRHVPTLPARACCHRPQANW